MTSKLETLTDDIREEVASHLSCETDELSPVETTETVEQIESVWHDCSRDLSHLTKAERTAYLQRSVSTCRPNLVDGLAVHLYSDVQSRKGDARHSVAVVDIGDSRLVFVGA